MRVLFLLVAWLVLSTVAPPSLQRLPDPPRRPLLSFEPLPLEPGVKRGRVGGLLYLGGWQMRSNDYRFGGISAMHVDASNVLAVSDAGIVFRFARPDRAPFPTVEIMSLPEAPGSPKRKSDRDAESLVVDGRRLWIGFERRNQVWRYARTTLAKEESAAPPAMRKWRANSGSEAMVRLEDGRFLVFSEGGGDGDSDLLLFEGDPALSDTKSIRLRYRAPDGYRVTDASILPDGRLIFLNRRFAWLEGMSARLSVARLPALKPGMLIEGKVLAEIKAPLVVDNLEALSVTEENGRTIIWIASDDNYNPLQQSLLLKFMLAE